MRVVQVGDRSLQIVRALPGLPGPPGQSGLLTLGTGFTIPASHLTLVSITLASGTLNDGDSLGVLVQGIICVIAKTAGTISIRRYLPAATSTTIPANSVATVISLPATVFPIAANFSVPISGGVDVTLSLVESVPTGQTHFVAIESISGNLVKQASANIWRFTPAAYPATSVAINCLINYFEISAQLPPQNPLAVGAARLQEKTIGDVAFAVPAPSGKWYFRILRNGLFEVLFLKARTSIESATGIFRSIVASQDVTVAGAKLADSPYSPPFALVDRLKRKIATVATDGIITVLGIKGLNFSLTKVQADIQGLTFKQLNYPQVIALLSPLGKIIAEIRADGAVKILSLIVANARFYSGGYLNPFSLTDSRRRRILTVRKNGEVAVDRLNVGTIKGDLRNVGDGAEVIGTKLYYNDRDLSGRIQVFTQDLNAAALKSQITFEGNNRIVGQHDSKPLFVTDRRGYNELFWLKNNRQARAVDNGKIVTWGDSTTADYHTQLEALYRNNRVVYKRGVGGAKPAEIAARQGGSPASFTVVGGVIPQMGVVEVTLVEIDLPMNSRDLCKNVEDGLMGFLGPIYGRLQKDPYNAAPGSGTYTFTRANSGAEYTAGGTALTFQWVEEQELAESTAVIWVGRNGGTNNSGEVANTLGHVAAMVANLRPIQPRYLILGLYFTCPVQGRLGTYPGEGVGTASRALIQGYKDALSSTYGSNYFDMGSWMYQTQLTMHQSGDPRFNFPSLTGDIIGTSTLQYSAADQINVYQTMSLCPITGIYNNEDYGWLEDPIHENVWGQNQVAQKVKGILDEKGW